MCGVKTNSKRVEAKEQKQFIFIQTDKPIYKPGQKSMLVVCALFTADKIFKKYNVAYVVCVPASTSIEIL